MTQNIIPENFAGQLTGLALNMTLPAAALVGAQLQVARYAMAAPYLSAKTFRPAIEAGKAAQSAAPNAPSVTKPAKAKRAAAPKAKPKPKAKAVAAPVAPAAKTPSKAAPKVKAAAKPQTASSAPQAKAKKAAVASASKSPAQNAPKPKAAAKPQKASPAPAKAKPAANKVAAPQTTTYQSKATNGKSGSVTLPAMPERPKSSDKGSR